MNTRFHAVTDADGRPIRVFMAAGQVRDHPDAATHLSSLFSADWLLADRWYDAEWFREALKDKGIRPCIPGRTSRDKPVKHDNRRTRIKTMFGCLKDWRRVAIRYDRARKISSLLSHAPQRSCFGDDQRPSPDPAVRPPERGPASSGLPKPRQRIA